VTSVFPVSMHSTQSGARVGRVAAVWVKIHTSNTAATEHHLHEWASPF